jgi:TolA-binding protein
VDIAEARPAASEPSPGPAASAEPTAPVASFEDVAPGSANLRAAVSNAPELFSSANRARRTGDLAAAVLLYQRLCQDFPRSSEAETAHLTLGVVYLQQHKPGSALEQFRICRASGVGTSLVEALWGEAQALRELGRAAEERAALARIVREFPDSAYVNAARKRLSDLP